MTALFYAWSTCTFEVLLLLWRKFFVTCVFHGCILVILYYCNGCKKLIQMQLSVKLFYSSKSAKLGVDYSRHFTSSSSDELLKLFYFLTPCTFSGYFLLAGSICSSHWNTSLFSTTVIWYWQSITICVLVSRRAVKYEDKISPHFCHACITCLIGFYHMFLRSQG